MPTTLPLSLLREKFEKLPPKLREAIASVDTANIVLNIGRTNGLSIDKIGGLASETGYIMSGVASTKDFIPTLTEILGVSNEKAKAIALEINQKIFLPIREYLKGMHGEKWAEEIKDGVASATAKPRAAPPLPEKEPAGPPAPRDVKMPLPAPADSFAKKLEPLIINPLTPRRGAAEEGAGPVEIKEEIRPPLTAKPVRSPIPPESKTVPREPDIKPFKARVMGDEGEALAIERVPEKRMEAIIPFQPSQLPKEYLSSKETVTKELEGFQKIQEKPETKMPSPTTVITKEKLAADIEKSRAELKAGNQAEKMPEPPAADSEKSAAPAPEVPRAEATKPAGTQPYSTDPYREPVE